MDKGRALGWLSPTSVSLEVRESPVYRITSGFCAEFSAHVTRHVTVKNGGFDGPLDPFRIVRAAERLEHQRGRQDRADRVGLFPASGGAEPCTGSNIEVLPGWRFADAAMPSPPCSAPPRSVMMSPNRLLVTITSNCAGSWTSYIASASM